MPLIFIMVLSESVGIVAYKKAFGIPSVMMTHYCLSSITPAMSVASESTVGRPDSSLLTFSLWILLTERAPPFTIPSRFSSKNDRIYVALFNLFSSRSSFLAGSKAARS